VFDFSLQKQCPTSAIRRDLHLHIDRALKSDGRITLNYAAFCPIEVAEPAERRHWV
jgi:hypothetical protein